MATEQDRVTALTSVVAPLVAAAGYDLEELTVIPAGRRRMVRVVIDSDSGVDLDQAAEISRDVSARLDAMDEMDDPAGNPLGAAYTLEVTSPGIGRPLSAPRHFRRARGRLVAFTLTDGAALIARVRQADDTGVDILTGRSGIEPQRVVYDDIRAARVQVEFAAPSVAVLAALGDSAHVLEQDDAAGMDPPALSEVTEQQR